MLSHHYGRVVMVWSYQPLRSFANNIMEDGIAGTKYILAGQYKKLDWKVPAPK